MEKIWYYTIDGERHGPVTASELKQLASQGTIKPDDLLWKEGLAEWMPAKKMKGLFPQGESALQEQAKPRPDEETKPRSEAPQDDSPKNNRGNLNLSGSKDRGDSDSEKPRFRADDRDDNRRPSRSSRRDDDDFDDGLDDPDERRRPSRSSRRDDDDDYRDRDRDRRSNRRDDYRDHDDDYRTNRSDYQRDDYDDARPRRANGKNPTLGIVSLICGILSIILVPVGFFGVCCFLFFFVNALPMIPAGVALICGGLGLSRSHRGMSMAGVITGGIGLLLSIIMLVISIAYPALMMATAPPPAPAGGGGWNPPPQNPPIVRPGPR